MKVLHLSNISPAKVGSYEVSQAALARRSASVGVETVCAFAGEPVPEVAVLWQATGLRWHVIDGWDRPPKGVRPWRICLPALRLIASERPDVVAIHFGNELPFAALIVLSRLLFPARRIAWVWHQHQQVSEPARFYRRHLSRIRLMSWFCDALAVQYEGARDVLLKRMVAPRKIHVVANGVAELESRRPKGWIHQELGLDNCAPLIVNVSSLIPRKMVDVCIRSLALCLRTIRQSQPGPEATTGGAHLLVVGRGDERAGLERLSSDLGVAAQVHFLGYRRDVRELIASSDVLMLTSAAESSPSVLLEASSAGVPCVATDAGAAREIIENGRSGFVERIGDVAGLAGRLCELLEDPDLRDRMGAAARQQWETKFRLEQSVDNTVELYRSLCTK